MTGFKVVNMSDNENLMCQCVPYAMENGDVKVTIIVGVKSHTFQLQRTQSFEELIAKVCKKLPDIKNSMLTVLELTPKKGGLVGIKRERPEGKLPSEVNEFTFFSEKNL